MRLLKTDEVREELQRLCLKTLTLSRQQELRTIMIAGCNEREGTSTVAINFSAILAREAQGKILLVDANLHHPTLEDAFGLIGAPGLTDVFTGEVALEAAIRPTEIENLFILPAGHEFSNPLSIFNSQKLEEYLSELKKGFQFILLDSAPVIPYSDSLHLSLKVDMILLVLEAGKTRWEVAKEAVQKLERGEGRVLGSVLNKREYPIPKFIYKRL